MIGAQLSFISRKFKGHEALEGLLTPTNPPNPYHFKFRKSLFCSEVRDHLFTNYVILIVRKAQHTKRLRDAFRVTSSEVIWAEAIYEASAFPMGIGNCPKRSPEHRLSQFCVFGCRTWCVDWVRIAALITDRQNLTHRSQENRTASVHPLR